MRRFSSSASKGCRRAASGNAERGRNALRPCHHIVTVNRAGSQGFWCQKCSIPVLDIETHTCQACRHCGTLSGNDASCRRYQMRITPTMPVTFKLSEATCWDAQGEEERPSHDSTPEVSPGLPAATAGLAGPVVMLTCPCWLPPAASVPPGWSGAASPGHYGRRGRRPWAVQSARLGDQHHCPLPILLRCGLGGQGQL